MSLASSVTGSLAQMFAPLSLALRDPDHMASLLQELGWTVDVAAEHMESIAAVLPVAEQIDDLVAIVEGYQTGTVEPGELVEQGVLLGQAVFGAIEALRSLSAGGVSNLIAPLDDPDTWKELALDLPEYLFLRWLRLYHPLAFALLMLGGVVEEESRAARDLPPRYTLSWEGLRDLLADPPKRLGEVYRWKTDFDHARLVSALARVARAMGVEARRDTPSEAIAQAYFGGSAASDVRQLVVPLHRGWSGDGKSYLILGLLAVPVPSSGSGDPDAMLVTNEIVGGSAATFDLGGGWSLSLSGSIDASGALGVMFDPGGVKLATGGAAVNVSIRLTGEPDEPWRLLGDGEGTRLQLERLEFEIAVEGSTAAPELILRADATDGLALVIEPGDGDSFLADVLGDEALTMRGGFSARWSSQDGFTLGGDVGLEIVVPVDLHAGPLRIDWFRVYLGAGTTGASTEISVTGSLDLGVFTIVVEDIGVFAALVPVDREDGPGDFGSVDAQVAFKPPTGLGIEIDAAGVVSGGGFLAWEPDEGRYAGVLDASVLGIGVTATGLLATKIPGAEGDWSWYLSLAARFTGVQLGFGFTLEGLGGLVGVNRGLDEDALAAGLRDGALDAIMFPNDPIADAPRILSQIDSIFPIAIGQFVFGPMVKIGWGTPSIIDVDLGVVIQFPDPVSVTLLGSLESILPFEELRLLVLRIDVAGTANLTEGTLTIDASLRDSQLLGVSLTGDVAIRARFLDEPSFCMAFGGFHPAFEPPADFPSLRRLGFALEHGDDFRLGLGAYFAVTSNTVQVGAEAELWARALGFTVSGGWSFDALIELSPFGFEIGLGAYVEVSAGSVDLLGVYVSGTLSGPTPWHVVGTATFKVLGIKKDIRIEATIGTSRPAARPSEDVEQLVRDALGEDGAWIEVLPDGASDAVLIGEDGGGAVHPAATLEVRQKVAPLDLTLERYGTASIAGDRKLTLTSPKVGGAAADASDHAVEEWFATAQFLELSDTEKLGAPSFERMSCGLRFSSDRVIAPEPKAIEIGYEQILRDPEHQVDSRLDVVHRLVPDSLAIGLAGSVATRQRKRAGFKLSTGKPSSFAIAETGWVLASTQTGLVEAEARTWSRARESLGGSARAGAARVVAPAHEVSP